MRFALEVTDAVRDAWPKDLPLSFHLSAIDGKGREIEDAVTLSRELKERRVDVIDCSAGGITGAPAFRTKDDGTPAASGDRPLGFQVPYAKKIRREAEVKTMAVGHIVDAQQAEDILIAGSADLITIGRELIYNPFWTLYASETLEADKAQASWPDQYRWAIVRRADLDRQSRP
jgi:2,4-dienoyl-CoA reductase-like NADH-dependent reductase (Old Yellow Enzyme family)